MVFRYDFRKALPPAAPLSGRSSYPTVPVFAFSLFLFAYQLDYSIGLSFVKAFSSPGPLLYLYAPAGGAFDFAQLNAGNGIVNLLGDLADLPVIDHHFLILPAQLAYR